ncbi:orexin/Hypocretin receptor type 1-like [Haliotis rubra]|uniref:orexin/Hypocretin receptor type 1-like n=1 Tax=Haliotis rubra TaxID=36100 RepID=UPI001EE60DE0|nr:orexin/Hypocretin receptor type 1-like [Haliotis rubra]
MAQDDNSTMYLHQYDDMYALKYRPAIVFVAVCMLVGVVGNSLVCYVYLRKFKPSTTRCFIVTLAILDILNCSLSIPLKIVQMRYHATFGLSNFCRVSTMTVTLFSLASAGVLLPVAVDRYLKICKPFVRQMTIFHAKAGCGAACAAALVLTIPPAIIHGPTIHSLPQANATFCYLADGEGGTRPHLIYSCVQICLFVVTAGALVVMYTCIWHKLYKQKKAFRQRIIAGILNTPKHNNTTRSTDGTSDKGKGIRSARQSFRKVSPSTAFGDVSNSNHGFDDSSETSCSDVNDTSAKPQTRCADKCSNIVTSTRNKASKPQSGPRALKTTFMLFIITAVFIISFLPHLILMIASFVKSNFEDSLQGAGIITYNIFLRSYFLNSAFNCIVYSFCNERFRNETKNLVVSCFR